MKPEIANLPEADVFAEQAGQLGSESAPEVLFHYTSYDTFKKIVESKTVWNTHILFTNDSTEFSHGMKLFSDRALGALETAGLDSLLTTSIKKFILSETNDPLAAPFIFCLTENGDQLGQWRGYGDDGKGVSIGFRSDFFRPMKVLYLEDHQSKIVDQAVELFIALIKKLYSQNLDLNDAANVRSIVLGLFRAIYMQSLRFKNDGWAEEQEWRAFLLKKKQDTSILFRPSGEKQIPYLTCDLGSLDLIKRIVIGPKANFELWSKELEYLKIQYGMSFELEKSKLTFR